VSEGRIVQMLFLIWGAIDLNENDS